MTAAKIQEPLNGSFHDDDNSQDILSLHPSDNHFNDGEGEDHPSIEEEISCRKAESLALRSTADRTDINNLFCAHPSVDIITAAEHCRFKSRYRDSGSDHQ